MAKTTCTKITGLTVKDVRFPTTLTADGSDAINIPDYSCAYVVLMTDSTYKGCGFTFTIGRGTEIVCMAVETYGKLIVNEKLEDIYGNFGSFWHKLVQEPQLRWLGPEKGVVHLAVGAIINALWDLWAKMEGKSPETLVSTIDFTYLSNALTKEEALDILKKGQKGKEEREKELLDNGFPAYTTSVGWMGYSDEKIARLCREAISEGFTRFKVKVGLNQQDDLRRVELVRREVGEDKVLLTDANQYWDVDQAIDWMKPFAKFNITWIEEPTSPDDILGHLAISKALTPYGIGVASGECCQNRIMFKQFLQSGALQYCQIDSCRLGGPNEILSVYLMAAKFGIPVCPHAGGVGLCELVQHLSIFDYISVSTSLDKRIIEYVDHLHEHFVDPVVLKNGCYLPPKKPGYSTEMKSKSVEDYQYPEGKAWQKLFKEGKFIKPN